MLNYIFHFILGCKGDEVEINSEPFSENADRDEDGVLQEDDCDDLNPNLGAISNDADCDGTITMDDCDDFDATFQDCPVCQDELPYWKSYHGFSVDDYLWRFGYREDGTVNTRFYREYLDEIGTIRIDFIYDENGDLSEKSMEVHSDTSTIHHFTCTEQSGSCIAELTVENTRYSFNEGGAEIERVETIEEEMRIVKNYLFDLQGRLVQESHEESRGDYVYQFDEYSITGTIFGYWYNDFGRRFVSYDSSINNYGTDYQYYADQKLSTTTEYYPNGQINKVIEEDIKKVNPSFMVFDTTKIIDEKHYTEDGEISYERTYNLDDILEGDLIIYETESIKEYLDGVVVLYSYEYEHHFDVLVEYESILQSFDSMGNEIGYTYSQSDFNDDQHQNILRTYDSYGNPLLNREVTGADYMWGEWTSVNTNTTSWEYLYNVAGGIISATEISINESEDCVLDSMTAEFDCTMNALPVTERFHVYDYDNNGNPSQNNIDMYVDDLYEKTDLITWDNTYDSLGNLLTVIKEEDLSSDGFVDTVEESTYNWDNMNRMLSYEYRKDEGADGNDDSYFTYEWEYDAQNQLTRQYVSHDNGISISRFFEKTWENTYDSNDNLSTQHYSKYNYMTDTTDTDVVYSWTYDSSRNITTQQKEDLLTQEKEYREWIHSGSSPTLVQYHLDVDGVIEEEFLSFCFE